MLLEEKSFTNGRIDIYAVKLVLENYGFLFYMYYIDFPFKDPHPDDSEQ